MYPTHLHPPGPNSCTQTLGIWMVCAMAQFLGEQGIPGTASFSLCERHFQNQLSSEHILIYIYSAR